MKISDINIPDRLIAQDPLLERDKCKLLCLDKKSGSLKHIIFDDICSLFNPGDLVIFNNSRVVKARFDGNKLTGGKLELFLLRPVYGYTNRWYSLIKGKNIKNDTVINIAGSDLKARIHSHNEDGTFIVIFDDKIDITKMMEEFGRLPLPPYIKRMPNTDDAKYYQTIFASEHGSVAAPTAALHFTDLLIKRIKDKGVNMGFVTLHVGYGTFSMVRDLDKHIMHEEYYSVPLELAEMVRKCKESSSRVWAVGTTVIRTLESAFDNNIELCKPKGNTSLFIRPGYKFKVVDAVITNFHHPETTLIQLVSAFAGVENIVKAYGEAVNKEYRLLSYGDAMAIM